MSTFYIIRTQKQLAPGEGEGEGEREEEEVRKSVYDLQSKTGRIK